MNNERQVLNLNIDDILPNRFQPRIKFNEQAINELAESIKLHGVIQPIVVRKISDKYEIIAGERRYKASILAGKTTIPAIVTTLDDKNSAEVALIENVQRQDLTPIEEAISYKKILDMGYISQGELGEKLGKKQSTIANKLRLLNLTDDVQEALMENKISERHARSLLKLDDKKQKIMLNRIVSERLTVRKTDEEIDKLLNESGIEQKIIENKGESIMNNDVLKEFNIPSEPIIDDIDNNIFNEQTINPTVEPVQPLPVQEDSFQQPVENSIIDNDIISEINPGFMDIEKIQNEAQDIITPPTPIADMNELLKSEVKPVEVMSQVEQPVPILEQAPQGGKFFNMFNFNEPEKDENFVEDVEEQKVNMDFGEPTYNNVFSNPINENFIKEEKTIEPVQPLPVQEDSFQQPVENSVIENNTISEIEQLPESIPVNPIIEEQPEPIPFGTPISSFSLTDDQEFSNISMTENKISETPIITEPISKSYMLDDDVKFNSDGEIEVQLPTNNEKFVTADMKTVINTIRTCAATIEKYGYKIETDEIDLENSYEVTFRIDKNV